MWLSVLLGVTTCWEAGRCVHPLLVTSVSCVEKSVVVTSEVDAVGLEPSFQEL